MIQDHIKISRSLIDWRWFDDPVMVYFWIRILLMANSEDRHWHDKVVKRGSFITTIASLSGQFNLSIKQVRTCLDRLRAGGEVTTNTSNNNTLITVCKYDCYQHSAANEGQIEGKCLANEKKNPPSLMVPNGSSPNNPSSFTPLLFPQEEMIKEGDTVVSPKKEAIDYDFIQNLWNESMKRKVPKVKTLADTRKEKIKLRIAEMGGWESAKGIIAECFKKINESEFCNGENENVWVATFDWFFMNDKNWLKVYEGNYDNRQRKSQLELYAENVAKADAYYEQRYHGYGGASPYGNQTGSGPYGPDEQ